jgi:thiosulfate/3-mercaptopyruvate sulfurtransferase
MQMSKYRLILTVAITGFFVACTPTPDPQPTEAPDPVQDPDEDREEEAMDLEVEEAELELPGVLVEPEWLEENLVDPELVVIHVGQEREQWEEAHIPGQIFIEFEDIVIGDFESGFFVPPVQDVRQVFEEAGVADNRRVVFTGELDGLMATRALFTLHVLGLTEHAAILDGGLDQWRDDDRQLSDVPVEAEVGSITVEADDEFVLEADDVMELLEEDGYALIDLRPEAEYTGEEAGDGVARPGHIPGAKNIFWKSTIVEEDRPLMLPTDEIEAIFEEAGVADDDVLVVYCRTGMQASFGYFLGKLLEREVLIYDGSYVDWASDPERPVE